jgi:hypothetical protein
MEAARTGKVGARRQSGTRCDARSLADLHRTSGSNVSSYSEAGIQTVWRLAAADRFFVAGFKGASPSINYVGQLRNK